MGQLASAPGLLSQRAALWCSQGRLQPRDSFFHFGLPHLEGATLAVGEPPVTRGMPAEAGLTPGAAAAFTVGQAGIHVLPSPECWLL